MSFAQKMVRDKIQELVIPYAGKMFMSSVGKKNKALCFVFNKGYLQTTDLNTLLTFEKAIEEDNVDVVLVGDLDRVKLTKGVVVYRQRIFFHSIVSVLKLCKIFGVAVTVPNDFRIDISNVVAIRSKLPVIEIYAQNQGETITEYLTNTCLVNFYIMLDYLGMYSSINERMEKFLANKKGYMNRAPFLVGNYGKGHSTLFLHANKKDERMYTGVSSDVSDLDYGFTEENIKKDGVKKK